VTWLHPEWTTAVATATAALAALATLSWVVARRRAARLLGSARAAGPAALARDGVLVAAFAALGAALLGPTLGTRVVRVPASGADIALLVDVSRSMDTADVPPSRLVRAGEIARAVLARVESDDRVALAVFGDRGHVLAPLTPDADALDEIAGALDGEFVEPRGSDLGAGIEAAASVFEAASGRPRVVLAIGDGEDADARDAGAAIARRANARVVSVAIGTESGGEVPNGTGPLLDARGRPIVSRRDVAPFESLAAATDGRVFRADRWGDVDLDALVASLRRDASSVSGGTVERRVPAERAAPLVAVAIALLAGEAIGLGAIGRAFARRRRAALATAAIAAIASLASATGPDDAIAWLEAQLRAHPGEPRALIALGVARADADRLDEAEHALRGAAVGAARPEDAAVAYYDLGVLALRRERFAEARDAFLDALALAPDDREARFNLEWSVRALASAPPEPKKRAGDDEHERDERPDPKQPDPNEPPAPRPDPSRQSDAKQPTPRPDAARNFAPELSPDRVAKWLDAVGDDPRRGMRDAARDADGRRGPRTGLARW
jgi:Ca-activated chloride channel family protein